MKYGFAYGWIIGWYLVGIYRMLAEQHLPMWFHIVYFICGAFTGIIIASLIERRDLNHETEKVPVSKRGKMEKVLTIIEENKELDYETLIEECSKINIHKWELNNFLDQLKRESQIIEPNKGVYRIL